MDPDSVRGPMSDEAVPEVAPEVPLRIAWPPDLKPEFWGLLDEEWGLSKMTHEQGIVRINLQGSRLTDSLVAAWVKWVKTNLRDKISNHTKLELDVSNNLITCKGAEALVFLLQDMPCYLLKLFKNDISDRGAMAFATLLRQGELRELHVSHNKIGIAGARALLEAAAEAYPINGVPLWLRLEANMISYVDLAAWEKKLHPLRRDGIDNIPFICKAPYGVGCNNSKCCLSKGGNAPVVHLPWIVRQRDGVPIEQNQTTQSLGWMPRGARRSGSRRARRSGSRPGSRVWWQVEENVDNETQPPPPPQPAPDQLRTKEETLRLQISDDGHARCKVVKGVHSPPMEYDEDNFLLVPQDHEVIVLLVGSNEDADWAWARNEATHSCGWIPISNIEPVVKRKIWQ